MGHGLDSCREDGKINAIISNGGTKFSWFCPSNIVYLFKNWWIYNFLTQRGLQLLHQSEFKTPW